MHHIYKNNISSCCGVKDLDENRHTHQREEERGDYFLCYRVYFFEINDDSNRKKTTITTKTINITLNALSPSIYLALRYHT
jgi:hypothetical protein